MSDSGQKDARPRAGSGDALPVRHDPDRMLFLTDGVIAIAVTLLALDLKPDLPHDASSSRLAHHLHQHGGQYFAFVLAFWLVARFWLVHHKTFAAVWQLDAPTMRANLLFLFGITCLPLTTDMKGSYPSALATTLFAGNLLLVSLALTLAGELVHRHALTLAQEDADERLARIGRAAGSAAVPALVMALAWVFPRAEYFFLLALIADAPAKLLARRHTRRVTAVVRAGGPASLPDIPVQG